MHPYIVIFGQKIQTYYVCAAAAGLFGAALSSAALRKIRQGVWAYFLPLFIAALALIGARALNVVTNPDAYGAQFSPWTFSYTKLSLMGGLTLGSAGIFVFCLCRKAAPGPILDAFALPAAAGVMLLKLGCFLNGCCCGKPTDGPFGMVFPANAAKYRFLDSLPLIHAASPRVHPTQLYELAGAATAIALALILERKLKLRAGGRFCVFAAGFSLARLLILPLRTLPYPDAVISVFYPCLYLFLILFCTVFPVLSGRRQREKNKSSVSEAEPSL